MATSITETGGSSTATETGNLEMSTKSNIIPVILPASEVLPTSEIGSSSTAEGSGDLALDITKMFESSKQKFSMEHLITVPDHLRILDEQAFTPRLISIGPIHRSNPKLQTMKKYKVRFCERLIRRAYINLQNLVHTIRDTEEEIRSYYAETVASSINSDDFVTMILVDGTFILEYFLRKYFPDLEKDDLTIRIPEWMHPTLQSDLVLLENQLPFFVLEMLFQQQNFPGGIESKFPPLSKLAFDFFGWYNFQTIPFQHVKIEHFTDLARFFYLRESEPIMGKRPMGVKLSYSATQLHEAGIKFKVAPERYGSHFFYISFDSKNGVLRIPRIKLNDENICLIRNIIALEQSRYVGHTYVTDFFVILDFLIDTSKDVDLLCDKGILINYLGDSNAAASAVNKLNTNILWDYLKDEYSKMCEDLNAFYKKPWHRWRATLWHQYFSTPWRFASTCAAVILLLLTLAQTVCSLKSTIW